MEHTHLIKVGFWIKGKQKQTKPSIGSHHSKSIEIDMSSTTLRDNGFNPSEKHARQIGSFPQVGVNIQKQFENHPDNIILPSISSTNPKK